MSAHHVTVLLLHVGVIVRCVWPGPGEEQVTIPSPVDQGPLNQRMVDELTPVIGIQTYERKRQPGLNRRPLPHLEMPA